MSIHASRSPSKRPRFKYCPGSIREESRYPATPSGPAAIDGTHDHTLLEKCINDYKDAAAYVGLKLSDHEGEFMVDGERAERVQVALNYVERRSKELEEQGHEVTVLSEKRVKLGSLVGRDDMDGTVDIRINTPTFMEVIDYKGGINPTNAREQMEQYAVGGVAEYHDRGLLAPMHIKLTVVQPKLRMRGMNPITSFDYTLGEIMQVKDALIAEAAATDAPDAPLVPGEKQCKYCAHKGACSALSTKVLSDSGISFKGIDVVTQAADKEPTSMTDQQLREIIESAPLLRQMIEAAEAEALRRLEQGSVIEGIKAVRGAGSRSWLIDDEEEMAKKLQSFKIPADVVYKKTLITLPKVIGLDGKSPLRWTKKDGTQCQLSDRQIEVLKNEYTKKKEGKISVAPASDPRPAVTLSVAQMFTPTVSTETFELPAFLR